MSDENSNKSKLSWPKTLVRKWFNIKTKAKDFHADDVVYGGDDEEWRTNYSERDTSTSTPTIKKSRTERLSKRHADRTGRGKIDLDSSQVTDVHSYRIFVATWNVAGKSPPSHLNLKDWLHTSPPADIYVLGFQEIVPLNAGNVLGTEDNGPARKWLALVRRTLNSLPGTGCAFRTPSPVPDPIVELNADFEGSSISQNVSSFMCRGSFQSRSRSMRLDTDVLEQKSQTDRRFSVCDGVILGHRPSDFEAPSFMRGSSDEESGPGISPGSMHYSPMSYNGSVSMEDRVWIRGDLRDDVRNMKVSCVGRGLMGYLGNKGSISISMSLHQTSFCFVCSHLTSGQKEGDELRRNSDVMEILRKTSFPRVHGMGDDNSPQTILDHDRVIWLGDLNYRIALSYRYAKALVEMRDWRALLENDQLRMEQRQGRVFEGWNEGEIYFPPTYKYSNNSDRYAGEAIHRKGKRRTPAWCDRILWYGGGLNQLSYVRGETRFSDHKPVYSLFLADVESINRNRIKKSMGFSSSRVGVEELLPYPYGYNQLNFL